MINRLNFNFGLILLASILCLNHALAAVEFGSPTAKYQALLINIRGDVSVNGKPVQHRAAGLKTGSVVTTGVGKCSVLYGKDTIIHLDKRTEILLDDLAISGDGRETSAIRLETGRVRALVRTKDVLNQGAAMDLPVRATPDTIQVSQAAPGVKIASAPVPSPPVTKPKFNIKTRSATMGVRGTHVIVDAPREGVPQFLTVAGSAVLTLDRQEGPGTDKSEDGGGSKERSAPEAKAPAAKAAVSVVLEAGQGLVLTKDMEVALRAAPPAESPGQKPGDADQRGKGDHGGQGGSATEAGASAGGAEGPRGRPGSQAGGSMAGLVDHFSGDQMRGIADSIASQPAQVLSGGDVRGLETGTKDNFTQRPPPPPPPPPMPGSFDPKLDPVENATRIAPVDATVTLTGHKVGG